MSERWVVILGHPDADSLCGALARRYVESAREAGREVSLFCLGDLQFDPVLRHGYRQPQPLEPDLQRLQQAIADAQQLVLVLPLWWGGMPALLKGMFDRVFLSGWAYRYRQDSVWWDKLLRGRRAEVIVTMDTPGWYYRWVYGQPLFRQLKHTILGFCGFAPVRITALAPVRGSNSTQQARWLEQVAQLAARG
ncbi:NAD(P)H-dependent oxidoreductase [Vogesella indigofera]|uniref:NAD(P)H-dependent oxidoreductase n=1 Tax=Vogesella indigofera TaxID=45465 RepID=UPI003F41D1B1